MAEQLKATGEQINNFKKSQPKEENKKQITIKGVKREELS